MHLHMRHTSLYKVTHLSQRELSCAIILDMHTVYVYQHPFQYHFGIEITCIYVCVLELKSPQTQDQPRIYVCTAIINETLHHPV